MTTWRKRWGDRGLSRKLNNARLVQALSMAMESGLPVEEALDMAERLMEMRVRGSITERRINPTKTEHTSTKAGSTRLTAPSKAFSPSSGDETRYTVYYNIFASNLMPDITVLEDTK